MNLLREKLNAGQKIRGTLVSTTDPAMCEVMGNLGYDCVWIDTEHTYMSEKEVLCHLNAARSANIPAIVRLPQDDLTATKKILEMGPDGVIFPMVRSAAEAEELIKMTLYPPLGNRGFGPLRAIGYGAMDAKEYTMNKSLELCRFLQIEHHQLIDELEEVLKNPYIDGFIFGPNDLSGSLGEMLNVFGEKTLSRIREAIPIIRAHGKTVGLAGGMTEYEIKNWSALGLDMLFAGADWCFIYSAGKSTLDTLSNYLK